MHNLKKTTLIIRKTFWLSSFTDLKLTEKILPLIKKGETYFGKIHIWSLTFEKVDSFLTSNLYMFPNPKLMQIQSVSISSQIPDFWFSPVFLVRDQTRLRATKTSKALSVGKNSVNKQSRKQFTGTRIKWGENPNLVTNKANRKFQQNYTKYFDWTNCAFKTFSPTIF